MMKSTFLFCTKLRMFLSEIPPLILLIISIKYTNKVESFFGLWPLILILIGFMIFTVIFLFRYISISFEEIKMVGVYSSKDRREISEGKTLKLKASKHRRLSVELWGFDKNPEFDWMDKNETSEKEVNLFREKAVGGTKSIERVLAFLGVPKDETYLFCNKTPFEKEYENIFVSSSLDVDDITVSVKFLSTL